MYVGYSLPIECSMLVEVCVNNVILNVQTFRSQHGAVLVSQWFGPGIPMVRATCAYDAGLVCPWVRLGVHMFGRLPVQLVSEE